MHKTWIKKLPSLLTMMVMSLVALMASSQSPAEAGKKKLFFGGHPGAYGNKHHGGNTYKPNAHKAKAKARARARAKARARAAAKAKARRRAIAAKKRKAHAAARARATASQRRGTGPTESNTTVAPSTAALLTKKELDGAAETQTKRSPDGKVTVATTSEEKTTDASSSASSIGEGACKKFVPEVGTAVAVPCD